MASPSGLKGGTGYVTLSTCFKSANMYLPIRLYYICRPRLHSVLLKWMIKEWWWRPEDKTSVNCWLPIRCPKLETQCDVWMWMSACKLISLYGWWMVVLFQGLPISSFWSLTIWNLSGNEAKWADITRNPMSMEELQRWGISTALLVISMAFWLIFKAELWNFKSREPLISIWRIVIVLVDFTLSFVYHKPTLNRTRINWTTPPN